MIKLLKRHWQWRLERFYRRNRWHLVLDLSLLVVIVVLATVVITLFSYHPRFSNLISGSQPGEINLENPPLSLTFSVPQPGFKLADGAELEIRLDNSGDSELEDIAIDLETTNQDFSVVGIEPLTEISGLDVVGQRLSLSKLPAKASLVLKAKVSFSTKSETAKIIGWQAQSAYTYNGQVIKDAWILPELKLKSELKAKAFAYYNSPQGDQLGVGPLPPVVGIPTTYWLFLEVSSDGSFKDLVFSGKLPAGVELSGQRSLLAGEFKYNTSTRQVLWRLKAVEAEETNYRIGFEVSFKPTEDQLGQVANLMTDVRYYAQDGVTAESVEGYLDDLDTDLSADKLNHGRGRTVKP